MATLIPGPRVSYTPTLEEIEAKTAEFRAQHRKQKRLDEVNHRRNYRNRMAKKRRREMTKADICNVEFSPQLDDLLDVFKMLSEASHDCLDALENDNARWTITDGKGVE